MAAPAIRAVGAVAANAAAISPGLPTGTVAGDLLIMFLECRGEESSGASGWTQVLAPVSTGTTTGGTKLTVLYKVAAGGDATTTNDSGNHQIGRIIGIQAGTWNTVNPFNVTNTGTDATSATAITIPSVTTTIKDCLILGAVTGNLPDSTSTTQFSGWTNANLASLTERIDNTSTAGDGGALGVVSGTFNSAGASGTISLNCVTWATRAKATIAIAPAYYTYTSSLGVINSVGFEATVEVVQPAGSYDATGALGTANAVGFSATVQIEKLFGVTSENGLINVEGFDGSVGKQVSAEIISGTVNFDGFVSSGIRFYDALGYVQAVGFSPTVEVISRQADPAYGEIRAEGFIASVEVIQPSTGYDATGSLGEVNAVGFAATATSERTGLGTSGTAHAEGFAPSVGVEFTVSNQTGEATISGESATVTIAGLAQPSTGEAYFSGNAATISREYELILPQEQGAGSGRFSPFERDEEDILEIVQLFLKKVA